MHIADIKTLETILKNPGAEYRSLPFWGWNERMVSQEMERQISDIKEKGIGGCFAHSRDGLETPYLSKEWMDDIKHAAAKCKENGLEFWIYDEDKWPSGSAGGKVSQMDQTRFTAKGLTLEVLPAEESFVLDETRECIVLDVFAEIEGQRIVLLGKGTKRIVLRRELSKPSEWYNGSAPSDMLNEEATQAFLDLTHERYKEEFHGDLKSCISGFFTDEPNCYDFFSAFTEGRPWLPWTDDFAETFTVKRGYRPEMLLPYLFFDGEGCTKIRHDYWRTVTELFGERYLKKVYNWCQANGIKLTGHVLYENDLGYNIRVCGAAMPQYRYLHVPGIDLLGDQRREYLTVRQCTSAAHQYGRDMTITETYGATGWDFDFEAQKRLGDWQYIMGINRRCQHIMQYSITGCRKRDYPPVFNYQSPWWEYYRYMEDYFARMSACANTGEIVRDILVIHPLSSLWTMCSSDPNEDLKNIEMNQGWKDPQFTKLNELGDEYNRFAEILTCQHFDFDFGDEIILSEIGEVAGNALRVGECTYHCVVIPKVYSLFKSTVKLLKRFVSNGGCVMWVGEQPRFIEGTVSTEAEELYNSPSVLHLDSYESICCALPRTHRVISSRGGEDADVLTMLRKTDSGLILITTNQDKNNPHAFRIELPENGTVTAYDPWNNKKKPMSVQTNQDGIAFTDELQADESRVYILSKDAQTHDGALTYGYRHPHAADNVFAVLGPTAHIERSMPNALVLDRCRYSLNGESYSAETDIWQAQRRIRERLGYQQVYYNGIPQRYTWLDQAKEQRTAQFALESEFYVRDVPEHQVYIAVEKPFDLSVSCNGIKCTATEEWYLDRGIKLFSVPSIVTGKNTILITGVYSPERELEDMFLLGDFKVGSDRVITKETDTLHFGDWCLQGYYHYCGAIAYSFDLGGYTDNDRIILKLGEFKGILAEVLINGISAGILFGIGNREADITGLLRADANIVTVKVVGSPRNLLGPLHRVYDGCSRISWEDFRTEGKLYTKDYVVCPCGLMGQIILKRVKKEGAAWQ